MTLIKWLVAVMVLGKLTYEILFALISALTLSTSVQAGISDELHKKCLEARDYAGCVNTNKIGRAHV